MNRKRILELTLAVVCIVSLPGYLVSLYMSRHSAASTPKPPSADPRVEDAIKDGSSLEQDKRYEEAIAKFELAEVFAAKMPEGKNAALEEIVEHLANCNLALGRTDISQNYRLWLIKLYTGDAEKLGRANQWDAAAPKLQQAEQIALRLDPQDETLLQNAREALAEAFWKLKRYQEADDVFDRMIASVRRPLNDYDSALGSKYFQIALLRSRLEDWPGAEKASMRAIEEYDKTIQSYPEKDAYGKQLTGNARVGKAVSMYNLAVAYQKESKLDQGLSAAEDAFQFNSQLFGSTEMAKSIAELGVQLASAAQKPDLVSQWQNRLSTLPARP